MVASGGERHVDTSDAQGLLARILFSISWIMHVDNRITEAWEMDGILKVAVKITIS